MKKIFLIILMISLISLTGCVVELGDGLHIDLGDNGITKGAVKTGDLKTFTESIDLGNQDELDVSIKVSAAKIDLGRSEEKLFEGSVDTDIVGLEPKMELKGDKLLIKDDFSYNSIKRFTNDWNLKITDKVPLKIDADINAARGYFDLSGMMIKDIDMRFNASNTVIRFDEKNKEDLKNIEIDINAGSIEMLGLDNAAPRDIGVEVNAGNVELDFGDNFSRDMDISIDGNASKTTISLPDNIGILIERESSLISLNLEKSGFTNDGDVYKSENYDTAEYKVNIEINGTASGVTIK